jgi:hypothetical protein
MFLRLLDKLDNPNSLGIMTINDMVGQEPVAKGL